MITFLASPKPFKGITKEHQYRAIQSWLLVGNNIEVILYGDSDGIDEAGHDLGVKVVKRINSAPSGIPYFGSIVEHAAVNGKYDLQVYINCDILLCGILEAIIAIELSQFLLIGQRIDLGEEVLIDLSKKDLIQHLCRLEGQGKVTLHSPTGIDYFAFRRGMWQGVPPIIIGRGGYDNAILAYCMRNDIPIVDGTFDVIAIHQFHDYDHMRGGVKVVMRGQDASININQAGGKRSATMVSDANYVLRASQVLPWPCRGDRLRFIELKLRYKYGLLNMSLILRLVWRCFEVIGLTYIPHLSFEEVINTYICNCKNNFKKCNK